MRFYEWFTRNCARMNISPSRIATEVLETSPATVSQWKTRGSVPNSQVIAKLEEFFGEKYTEEKSVDDTLQELFDRPEFRILFSTSKNATTEQIMKAALYLEELKNADRKR